MAGLTSVSLKSTLATLTGLASGSIVVTPVPGLGYEVGFLAVAAPSLIGVVAPFTLVESVKGVKEVQTLTVATAAVYGLTFKLVHLKRTPVLHHVAA